MYRHSSHRWRHGRRIHLPYCSDLLPYSRLFLLAVAGKLRRSGKSDITMLLRIPFNSVKISISQNFAHEISWKRKFPERNITVCSLPQRRSDVKQERAGEIVEAAQNAELKGECGQHTVCFPFQRRDRIPLRFYLIMYNFGFTGTLYMPLLSLYLPFFIAF